MIRLFLALLLVFPLPALAASACVPVGGWRDLADGAPVAADTLLARAAQASVVLLGERHDSAAHHRWQLDVIQALAAGEHPIALGLEMVPRRHQPALDRWVAGETDEQTFLKEVEWQKVWRFDPDLYLPILRFARDRRIPLVALNVDQGLVRRVGTEGWAAVPAGQREGVGDPAPAAPAYLDRLAAIHALHRPGESDTESGRDDPGFRRFVEAQLLWDRAMAERIAEARRETGRQVMAIMGGGHLEERLGVPYQLADIGIKDALVLLPWDTDRDCADLSPSLADAVYAVPPEPEPRRPRLGVALEPDADGARVAGVMPGSVAARAGLQTGDVVLRAGGQAVAAPEDLIRVVRDQPAEAALALTVRRAADTVELTARFPAD